MGDQYTIADPYLFTTLGWSAYVGFDMGRWPRLTQFHERIGARPSVKAAVRAEVVHAVDSGQAV